MREGAGLRSGSGDHDALQITEDAHLARTAIDMTTVAHGGNNDGGPKAPNRQPRMAIVGRVGTGATDAARSNIARWIPSIQILKAGRQ